MDTIAASASQYDFDLFVIGAGSGGVRAARIAANHGAKVGIAESSRIGGTCVIRGCVPKKLLVHASRLGQEFEHAADMGWLLAPAQFDWPTLIANKDQEIARLEKAYRANLERSGVKVFDGRGFVKPGNRVGIGEEGREFKARYVLIATGSTPNHQFDFPGFEHTINSDALFELKELPKSAVIVGGGYIAVEFAGVLHGFGVRTHVVHRGASLLRGFDEDIREEVSESYRTRGIDLFLNKTIKSVKKIKSEYEVELSDGTRLEVGLVLMAAGRSPNSAGIGLENVGVVLGQDGAVKVDGKGQTSSTWVYAVGDVTNKVNLTPVAIREGHAFADRLFGSSESIPNYLNIPTAIFSTPELAVVGLTEMDAGSSVSRLDVYRSNFKPLKSSLSKSADRVTLKLLVDRDSDHVVGAQAVGDGAAEMIQLIAVAMFAKVTKRDFDRTMALHPTVAEEWTTMRHVERTLVAGDTNEAGIELETAERKNQMNP